jgi:hypothetical protein
MIFSSPVLKIGQLNEALGITEQVRVIMSVCHRENTMFLSHDDGCFTYLWWSLKLQVQTPEKIVCRVWFGSTERGFRNNRTSHYVCVPQRKHDVSFTRWWMFYVSLMKFETTSSNNLKLHASPWKKEKSYMHESRIFPGATCMLIYQLL